MVKNTYDNDGNLIKMSDYKDNKLDGKVITFNNDGTVRNVEYYVKGKKVNKLTYYQTYDSELKEAIRNYIKQEFTIDPSEHVIQRIKSIIIYSDDKDIKTIDKIKCAVNSFVSELFMMYDFTPERK